jgi:hypothetical protein
MGFYIGFEYERWDYNSSNLEVAKSHDVKNVSDPGAWAADYSYELAAASEFRFKRKLNRFGVDLGAHYELSDRFSLLIDFHVWYAKQRMKFDEENSSGVTWITEAPTDWVAGFFAGNDMSARFSLTLKFRLL